MRLLLVFMLLPAPLLAQRDAWEALCNAPLSAGVEDGIGDQSRLIDWLHVNVRGPQRAAYVRAQTLGRRGGDTLRRASHRSDCLLADLMDARDAYEHHSRARRSRHDRDADGIDDRADLCPHSLEDVDEWGCTASQREPNAVVSVTQAPPLSPNAPPIHARLLQIGEITYPDQARLMALEGVVEIDATIAADGALRDARAIAGPEPLRDAALEAVRHARFAPARDEHDRAVESVLRVPVRFRLDR